MPPPRLVADRFLLGEGSAIDLASGDAVLLQVGRRPHGHADWAERCARLASLSHPWLAACIDFGAMGEAYTFEAYRLVAPATCRVTTREMTAVVGRFLASRGLHERVQCIATDAGRVVVPSMMSAPSATPVDGRVAAWQDGALPQAVQAIVDRLRCDARPGLSRCDLSTSPGRERRRLLRVVAREARLAGWVPVDVRVLCGRALAAMVFDLLSGRHVVLLEDHRSADLPERGAYASALARLAARSDRPGLLVRTVDAWAPRSGTTRSPVVAARGGSSPGFRDDAHGWGVAREAPATYSAAEPAVRPPRPRIVSRGGGPQVLDTARALLSRGRHAAAERALRQAAAAAARREAARESAALWIALARLLLGRGRALAAAGVLDEADPSAPCSEGRRRCCCSMARAPSPRFAGPPRRRASPVTRWSLMAPRCVQPRACGGSAALPTRGRSRCRNSTRSRDCRAPSRWTRWPCWHVSISVTACPMPRQPT
jgi:hypothetical protein